MSSRDSPPVVALDQLDEAALIRALIDAVPDPFFLKDIQGRYLLANHANSALFGLEPGAEIGKTVYDIAGLKENAALYDADDRQVISTGEAILNHEEPFLRPDGSQGWFLTSKYPIKDARGVVIGLVGIARNVTKRRE